LVFKPELEIGTKITNKQLMEIFRCGEKGGMRRSLKTNTLTLISHIGGREYIDNQKDDEGIWHFQGMGLEGDQSLNYMQNKTLVDSNISGTQLYLFRRKIARNYEYLGRVLLAGEPYEIDDPFLEVERTRKIIIFPLVEVGKEMDVTSFLLQFSIDELVTKGLLDPVSKIFKKESAEVLITLMNEKEVDTLTSGNNWYLSRKGVFYNQHASGIKLGKYKELLKNKKILWDDILKKQDQYINPYYKGSFVYEHDKQEQHSKVKIPSKIRVLSLEFNEYNIKDPIKFGDFSEKKTESDFYTSLLIGPNGTGKSYIISLIQKIFTDIYRLRASKMSEISKSKDYKLVYLIGKTVYQIKQEKGEIEFKKGKSIISLKDIELPEKVISCSFTPHDRFSILSELEQDIKQYEYLGTKNYIKRNNVQDISNIVASNIMLASLSDNILFANLKDMTAFLGFKNVIRITFKTAQNILLNQIINEDSIVEKQNEIKKKFPDTEMMFSEDIKEFLNETWNKQVDNLLIDEFNYDEPFYLTEGSITINFNLDTPKKYETLTDKFYSIWHLLDIGLLESPAIILTKANKPFPIEEASSGEYQYLSSMINILSKIKPRSLIILDEPETSLHPSWQYQYMSQLRSIFKKFGSCHFIIATHSHFMVSDLKPNNSSIITLIRGMNDHTEVNMLEETTYGRSAEDILYNVFNMPTTRNYYLGSDLDEILKAITFGTIDQSIRQKVNKLREVQTYLKETDPLKLLINKIIEKVGF
jgi:hypothetical protein